MSETTVTDVKTVGRSGKGSAPITVSVSTSTRPWDVIRLHSNPVLIVRYQT